MNKIVILLCSHRKEGKSRLALEALSDYTYVDTILFSDIHLEPCIQCAKCKNGQCIKYKEDEFNDLIDRIRRSDGFIVFSPLYSPIPSKLAAFLERLTSVSYFAQTLHHEEIPLSRKPCSVIGYDSSGKNKELEILIKKILTPILAGFEDKEQEFHFIESNSIQSVGMDNVVEYLSDILKKMN